MKKISFLLLLMLLLLSCKRDQQKGDMPSSNAAAVKTAESQATEQTENQAENTWGYQDKPSPDADLTREPPLEVVGGLVHDVGTLIAGEKKIYALVLKNTSDKPWKLQEIDADCACTNIDGIPGGVYLKPGEDYKVGLRIDGGKIHPGKFEKHIFLRPLEYKTVKVSIVGKLESFFATVPSGSRINFNAHGDPNAKWEGSINIFGINKAKDILEISLVEDAIKNPYIKATLEKLEDKRWKLTAKPLRALPYSANFNEKIVLKVDKPEGMPPIIVVVQGKVGMSLRWNRKPLVFKEDDFKDGVASRTFQLGIDVNDPRTTSNPKLMRQVEGVDWQKLFDALEVKVPEGAKYEKIFTRFGVKLNVTVPRSAFPEKGSLKIETGCNGNWEGVPISMHIKKEAAEDKK